MGHNIVSDCYVSFGMFQGLTLGARLSLPKLEQLFILGPESSDYTNPGFQAISEKLTRIVIDAHANPSSSPWKCLSELSLRIAPLAIINRYYQFLPLAHLTQLPLSRQTSRCS